MFVLTCCLVIVVVIIQNHPGAGEVRQVSRAMDKLERSDEVTDQITDQITDEITPGFVGKGKGRAVEGGGMYLKDKDKEAKGNLPSSNVEAAGLGADGPAQDGVGVSDTYSMTGEAMLMTWYTIEERVSHAL